MVDEDSNKEDGENLPPLDVLRHEYNRLREVNNSQKESWEKEGEHNRRMLRLTLVFTGIIITAISSGGFPQLRRALITEPYCAIYSGPTCIQTNHLMFFGLLGLILAAYFYIRGATGGIAVGAPYTPEEYEENFDRELKELSDYTNEPEYLDERIMVINQSIDHGYRAHRSQKMAERVASVSLLFSFVIFIILAATVALEANLNYVQMYTSAAVLAVLVLIIEWYSPMPLDIVEKIQGFLRGEEEDN